MYADSLTAWYQTLLFIPLIMCQMRDNVTWTKVLEKIESKLEMFNSPILCIFERFKKNTNWWTKVSASDLEVLVNLINEYKNSL
jgi:hypothetical protein